MHDLSSAAFLPTTVALPPVRGLLPIHNAAGQAFALPDCHRAMRYQCHAFDVLKMDVLADHLPGLDVMESIIAYAREFQVRVCLRTNGIYPPGLLAPWSEQGLMDVCLAGTWTAPPQAWLDACKAHGVPLRLMMPMRTVTPDLVTVHAWAQAGVKSVCMLAGRGESAAMEHGQAWRGALRENAVDCTLHACDSAQDVLLSLAEPEAGFFADHQQYDRAAYRFGAECHALSPRGLHAHLFFQALRLGGIETPSDHKLVHFLRRYTRLYKPVQTMARAVRHAASKAPRAPEPQAAAAVEHDETPRHYDAIDHERRNAAQILTTLAEEAHAWQREQSPNVTFDSASWGFENAFFDPMRGVNQVHTLLPGEKLTTKLPYLRPPFMVTVSLGGGMAEYIGFAIGRHIRIACPMVGTAHTLTLYVDGAGRYVLIRDRQPVAPARLDGRGYTPPRLPDGVHLQVALWSPEPEMSVTDVRAWQQPAAVPVESKPETLDVAVVIFSTRFARRLQAALQCIVHQKGIALERVQCIVGLVPGLDGAEDVVETMRLAYPQMRVQAVAFPPQFATAKGFALNECLALVRAGVVVLMDSDVLLPPGFLRAATDAAAEHGFVAPAGRAMLDAATTAKILLGEARPWEEFDALAGQAVETRREENVQEVPLGYCQVFKASALDTLRHAEYGHFGAADFEFGAALKEQFNGVHRLDMPVLHLDHDARQWFGARKHF